MRNVHRYNGIDLETEIHKIYQNWSKLPRLLDTASKFALFSVSDFKDEKFIKKQTYVKTETCKLYSRVS